MITLNKTPRLLFTTSWDDGYPLDLRLAELLHKYSIKGTFFIPSFNSEGKPVLKDSEIREIGGGFEIGSHTLEHVYLDSLRLEDATAQIVDGKKNIENILGRSVDGFCYPGGRHNKKIRDVVKKSDFIYARKVSNMDLDILDKYQIPTTLQFYPHRRTVFVKNYLTNGSLLRGRLLPILLRNKDMVSQHIAAMDYVVRNGGVFHLWGHSWEFDSFNGWVLLEEILKYAKDNFPASSFVENRQLIDIFKLTD